MTQSFKGERGWENLIWCCEQIAKHFDLAHGSHQTISQQKTEMYTNRRRPRFRNCKFSSDLGGSGVS